MINYISFFLSESLKKNQINENIKNKFEVQMNGHLLMENYKVNNVSKHIQ